MDVATLAGLVSGFLLLYATIILNGPFWLFFNLPAAACVLGGTLASLLVNFPMARLLGVVAVLKNAFFVKETPTEDLINTLVDLSITARREGILALENHGALAGDEFLARGLQLAVDGSDPDLIKDILSTEITFLEERHAMGVAVVEAAAAYGPAYGMIGTLIGLVQMLANLSDPALIGPSMAVAILTTLYGAIQANLVCLPCAGKLKLRTALELLHKEVIIEGILSIQSGDNPRVVEQKLKAFVAPDVRSRIAIGGSGPG
jgi:chemotaxis protein MotA